MTILADMNISIRNIFRLSILASLFLGGVAVADVWKWVDADGNTHFVDTRKAIYTWRDASGRIFYSDKKDHDAAVLVQLVWHSNGSLADVENENEEDDNGFLPGESEVDRAERLRAEAYYCKKATEVYESYVNAPRLYSTNDEGEKVYVSEKEADALIEETRLKVEELCG